VSQVLPVLLVLLVRPALVIPVQLVQQGPLVPPALSLGKVLLGLLGQLATAPPDLQVPQEPMGALGLVLKLLNFSPTTTQELQAKKYADSTNCILPGRLHWNWRRCQLHKWWFHWIVVCSKPRPLSPRLSRTFLGERLDWRLRKWTYYD